MHALLFVALLMSSAPDAEPRERGAAEDRAADGVAPQLRAYLRRPVPHSARFLDHGVIATRAAGGAPHLYRLDVQIGLFDHVSVGVTANWLPGMRAPQVWPVGAIALFRWVGASNVGVELGAHYRPVLFPPPADGQFARQTHLALASFVMSAGWFSAGLDAGAAHTRIPTVDPEDTASFRRRTVFGGGVFARVGNRRWGVTADALSALSPDPLLVVEVGVDVRFGAFEERGRGGWRGL
jgi:hypothetical protein